MGSLAILLNPQRILYGILIAVGAVGIWYVVSFVNAKHAAEQEVAALTQVVKARDFTIANLSLQAAQKEQSLKVADTTRSVLENLDVGYNGIRLEIASTPTGEDAPVAPVLRRALDALRGL